MKKAAQHGEKNMAGLYYRTHTTVVGLCYSAHTTSTIAGLYYSNYRTHTNIVGLCYSAHTTIIL